MRLTTLLLITFFSVYLTAQNSNNSTEVEYSYVNEPNSLVVFSTSFLSGVSFFSGLTNIHAGVRNQNTTGLNYFGAISGLSQMIMGTILFTTARQNTLNNQIVINKSNLNLRAINVGLGIFAFGSALFASSRNQNKSSNETTWNFYGGSVHDGRGGFSLGFSKKF